MLEEVIMNLQLTITNVQSFAIETNLSLIKLQKSSLVSTPVLTNEVTLPNILPDIYSNKYSTIDSLPDVTILSA